jgi:hypothetical protein
MLPAAHPMDEAALLTRLHPIARPLIMGEHIGVSPASIGEAGGARGPIRGPRRGDEGMLFVPRSISPLALAMR